MTTWEAPALDRRTYADLVDEALARIPVHNPEWTNFNRSDPGVTLVELFAFLTESLLYRANQIPERNRRAFLALMGVPLQPPSSATGLVAFTNLRGAPHTTTLARGIEVRAGGVPFRTQQALDVLPVECLAHVKARLTSPAPEVVAHYRQLYASYREGETDPAELELYETAVLSGAGGVDVVRDTVDRSLWLALLLREQPADAAEAAVLRSTTREELAGATLNVGIVPSPPAARAEARSGGHTASRPADVEVELPAPGPGALPEDDDARLPSYRRVDVRASVNVLDEPGVLQITLPDAAGLRLWEDLDPLEAGVGDFPPALPDTRLGERVVTWVRLRLPAGAATRVLWVGANAVMVTQRAEVVDEVLPDADGTPDQSLQLARTPVVPDSLRLRVSVLHGGRPSTEVWQRIDDLSTAGPEVPVPDLRRPPGAAQPAARPTRVFVLDPASGLVRFGDGLRGARPPAGARIRADYAYGAGRAGNVQAGTITAGPDLPPGFTVSNPVRTWGGAEGESVADGERQVARFLQHRDRLVSVEDFETIVRRAPGVDLGRVEVLPAFSPELPSNAPGDAPGAVTVLVVPSSDPSSPTAPVADQHVLDAVCAHVEPRRLVTTEVFLRPPTYVPVWISLGIDVEPGRSVAEVRDAVSRALSVYLSPLPRQLAVALLGAPLGDDTTYPHAERGWPLRKDVVGLELQAVASRVDGLRLVRGLLLGRATGGAGDVPVRGLELPKVEAVVVSAGDPLPLDVVRGTRAAAPSASRRLLPVPVVPETC